MIQKMLITPVLCLLTFSACQEVAETVTFNDDRVESALQPYFMSFVHEATIRGIPVTQAFYEITGSIEQIAEEQVAGQCWYNSHQPNEVNIDTEYWRAAGALDREFIVFHELGHCYLDRNHLDQSNPYGFCTSVMASGLGSCRYGYSPETRSAYLDELFFGPD